MNKEEILNDIEALRAEVKRLWALEEHHRAQDEVLRAIAHSSAPQYDLVLDEETHDTVRVMRPAKFQPWPDI